MWIGIGIGAVLVVLALNWRNVRRLKDAGAAQINKFSRWAWGIDPIAIYQAEVDKSAEEIQEACGNLAEVKGMVARCEKRVENCQKKIEQLKDKIRSFLQEGNEEKATNYILDLQRTQDDLIKEQQRLQEHKCLYDNNLKKLRYANQKIRDAKEKAERMQTDLRMSKAEAEVARLAQNFQIKTSSIDSLGVIEDEIQRQIDSNRAKGQVVHDLGNDGFEDLDTQERHDRQKAQILLEQFKQDLLIPPPMEVHILPAMKEHEKN